ncbi:MAG TPA: class I SAM-dependent methyltransferase, partial [Bacillota bacterium]
NVEELPFTDESFDTVIGTCVFCTVPDPSKGLSEARRVCRSDGRILLIEHMLSQRPLEAAPLRLLDPLLYLAIGDHPARRTGLYFAPAGLTITGVRDLWRGLVWAIEAVPGEVRPTRPWPYWTTPEVDDGDPDLPFLH